MVEFCYLGVLLLVPVVYGMIAMLNVQSASYAATGAAREAGRMLAALPEGADPYASALAAARTTARDFGIDDDDVHLICEPCLPRADGQQLIIIEVTARLPLAPGETGVLVKGSHLEHFGRYSAVGP